MSGVEVLDLFSAAAGGWSLGMHRAGYRTIPACEFVPWRRALYAQNNPDVRLYDDVRTLSADQLVRDLGRLPGMVVGSPPCQDISSANTKGRGVEGERSGLYFEATRLIGEIRPRWFALENSANLRTRGADAVLAALEAIGYACWAVVVRASDIGANHERPRAWLIGCDLAQVADADGDRWSAGWGGRRIGSDLSIPHDLGDPTQDGCGQGLSGRHSGATGRAEQPPWGHGGLGSRETPDPDQARQAHGCMVTGLRQAEIAEHGCGDGRSADRPGERQMAICPADRGHPDGPWPLWSLDDLAGRLRLDDGLPARVAGTRVAVGGPRGTTAASLIVEAYGDAVVPQIPEAIGRAILRTEAALAAIYAQRQAA